jgi:hypothetical protein
MPAVKRINDSVKQAPLQTTVERGQIGEAYVEEILRKRFPDIKNVTKNGKSGDLTLFIDHRKITVEVKNYSNPIPTHEVDKFRRDLCTTNASGGLFISLNTAITNITSDFTMRYEQTETVSVPCVYIVSSSENAICCAVAQLTSLLSCTAFIKQQCDTNTEAVYKISNGLDELSRTRNDLQCQLVNIHSKLIKTTSQLAIVESGIRNELTTLQRVCVSVMSVPDFEKHMMFLKQSETTKKLVHDIVKRINDKTTELHNCWKMTAKKCTHLSGLGIAFKVNGADLIIPRTMLTDEQIIHVISFEKKAIISTDVLITIDPTTIDWIYTVI